MSRKAISFWFIVLPDAMLLYLSLWLDIQVRYAGALSGHEFVLHARAFSLLYILWLLVLFIHGLFEVAVFRRYTTLFFNLLSAMVVNLVISIVYFYLQPNLILTPRRFLLIHVAFSFILILFWHLFIKYLLKNRLVESVYLFSFNNELGDLQKDIDSYNYLGYRILGHLNKDTLAQTEFDKNMGIILPENLSADPFVLQKFYELRTLGVKFYNYQDFYENLLRRVYLSQLNEVWFLENVNYRENRFYNFFRRIIDVVFGLFSFLCFLLTYPLFALFIKLESKGSVLFVQERVGQYGKNFKIFKYRTMSGGRTDNWTEVNDPRITKVGNIIRKLRIDELPQSINLLKGNISLVGPRPEQVGIVQSLRKDIPFYDERHFVKPGITGWAQLNIYAGSLEETKLKLQYDLYYIKHRSLFFDLEIILKTIYYIFTWKGR